MQPSMKADTAGTRQHSDAYQIIINQGVGLGAQSTLGGKTFLPENFVWKMPEFSRQLPKNIFPNFMGHVPPCPRRLRLCYAARARAVCIGDKVKVEHTSHLMCHL